MVKYKLIKIYDEIEDLERIKNHLNTTPLKINSNYVLVEYGFENRVTYSKINNFILSEEMDHVILYADTYLKLLSRLVEKNDSRITEIKLANTQDEIEATLSMLMDNIPQLIQFLKSSISGSNIDIREMIIKHNNGEIIFYNNGVIALEKFNLEFLLGVLCGGI